MRTKITLSLVLALMAGFATALKHGGSVARAEEDDAARDGGAISSTLVPAPAPPDVTSAGPFDPNNPNNMGIDPAQYSFCQVCSPQPYTPVASCPTLIGTLQACQAFCHVVDGAPITWFTDPPASGNHNPEPETVMGEHISPVERAHWVHSLEHGAIVMLYNCTNCDSQLAVLRQAIAQRPGLHVMLTPDPLLKSSTFSAVAWTYIYNFTTPDLASLLCFIDQHINNGRECTNPGTSSQVCAPL